MAPTIPSPHLRIRAEPLTSASFAAFGTVIASPLPPTRNTLPYPAPENSQLANQGTALVSEISPLISNYRLSPSGAPAQPHIRLFSSFPNQLRTSEQSAPADILDVRVLERHAYTTQTFVPLIPNSALGRAQSKYIVIVAPTLHRAEPGVGLTPYFPQVPSTGQIGGSGGLPDLKNIKAFVGEEGTGITYGVGVWHSPMIVTGPSRMDFVVVQYQSGREGEDCQEVDLGARHGEGIEVILGTQEMKVSAKL